MSTLSKVKSVEQTSEWTTKKGELMYTHKYEMEDGTKIKGNHKTVNPFAIGAEVEYEVKKDDPQYGKSGSIKKPGSGNYNASGGSKGQSGSNASFAISYAKDVLIASYTSPKAEVLVLSTDQMFALGDKIYDWMEEKKTPPNPEKVQEMAQNATDALMNEEN